MTRHRFTLQVGGQTVLGLAFATEAELEEYEAAAARGGVQTCAITAAAELQARGRPSYDAMLQAAVKALGRKLRRCSNVSRRARLVLKHLAETHGAQELPALRTVTAYLTAPKVGRKYGEKKKRAKLSRNGEI